MSHQYFNDFGTDNTLTPRDQVSNDDSIIMQHLLNDAYAMSSKNISIDTNSPAIRSNKMHLSTDKLLLLNENNGVIS